MDEMYPSIRENVTLRAKFSLAYCHIILICHAGWPSGGVKFYACPQKRPCAALSHVNSKTKIEAGFRSTRVPARSCPHQTAITKGAVPCHGLVHVLRMHRVHEAHGFVRGLLVGT